MTDFCHYHQKSPAIFECETCNRLYGECCLLPALVNQKCPVCEFSIKSLGAANTAEPFWDQINSFFRYPLKPASLSILSVSAIVLTLAGSGIIALIAYISLACVFTKYAYSIIQTSKDGKTEPPSFESAFSSENLDIFFKQMAVLILAGLAMVPFALTGSEFLVGVGSLVINGLMPASVIVLALTNRIGAALNPAVLLTVVRAIGKRYLLLWLFLFILAQSPVILAALLFEILPSAVLTPSLIFVTGYFALVICRLLGYTVYQNQGELGFVSEESEQENNLSEKENEDLVTQQTILNVELFVKEGDFPRARKLLTDRLNQKVKSLTLEEYYHRMMVVIGDTQAVIENADHAIEAFIRDNRMDLAIAAFTDCLKINKSYRPSSLKATLTLATSLASKLKSNLLIQLLTGCHKRFPDNVQVAEAYLLLAETFAINKNDSSKAQQYISFVKKHYPTYANHPKLAELSTI